MTNTLHVVGGAVRDRLMGRPVIDVDLSSPVNPTELAEKTAKKMNGSVFALDKERGIVRVSLPEGHHLDFVQWQGPTFEADIDRRDFSINALAVPLARWMEPDWKRHIIDRHDGLRDLKREIVRPISAKIFKEDPLRMLRAFRIAGELNFQLPTATLSMIRAHARSIAKPAPERKREEMLRLFATPNAHAMLVLMDKSGLLDEIFPEAKHLRVTAPKHYGKGGVLKHTLDSVQCFEQILEDKTWFRGLNEKIRAYLAEKISGHPRIAHCKWGLLLHDIGKPETMKMIDGRLRFFQHEHVGADKVAKIAPRFRWSSDETSRYANFVRHHMRPGNLAAHAPVTDKAIHRFFRELGDDAVAMLLVSLADHLTYLTPAQRRKRSSPHEKVTVKMIRRFYTQRETITPPKILTGYDVMKAFKLEPSPLIGALLADLQEAQSEGNIHSKTDALAYLRGRLPWHRKKIT